MPSVGEHDLKGSLVIPKWFLQVSLILATCFNIVFIPWAGWVTSTLFSIDAQTSSISSMANKVDTLSERVSTVEGRIQSLRYTN